MTYLDIRNLWNLFNKKQKVKASSLLVLLFFGMILEILGVAIVIPAFSLLLEIDILGDYPALMSFLSMFIEPSKDNIIFLGILLIVIIFVLKNVFLAFQFWFLAGFSLQILREFSEKLLRIYLSQPYKFHIERNSAFLIRNITNEVELFSGSVITPACILCAESLVVIGILSFLVYLEPLGLLMTGSILFSVSYLYNLATKNKINAWGKSRQHSAGFRFKYMKEALGGIKDIKILGREDFFLKLFKEHNLEYSEVARKHNTLLQMPRLWLEILAISVLAILVLVLSNKNTESIQIISTLGVFAFAAFRLLPSVNRMISSVQALNYGLPVIEKLNNEFRIDNFENEHYDSSTLEFKSNIEFKNVNFKYEKNQSNSLKSISFKIAKGESIGVIGPSGAGKTTLIDIILGLLEPDSGSVYIDNSNIKHHRRAWQDKVGYVPQNIFLTDDSFKNNIALGILEEDIDEEKLHDAIKKSHLVDVIEELNNGINTNIGEGGVKLSGGQRQRIGIARALYHRPEVLIMDEATSSLDSETESIIQESVNSLKGEKTIVIIAHRTSTIENCDRVLKLKHGIIEGFDKPSVLLT